ncbi:MAG: hypothetical protein AAF497_21615 [Planctomycetota bacterium]
MKNDVPNDPELSSDASPHFSLEMGADKPHAAWEEVDAGRFMPRRVRGSCQGRALG